MMEIKEPEKPIRVSRLPEVTINDAIAEMNINDRTKYLMYEAYSSVLGKLIHKGNAIEQARVNMHEAITSPYSYTNTGRDTTILHKEPSVNPSLVDEAYVRYQAAHRSNEQVLNHMKATLRQRVSELSANREKENLLKIEAYERAYNEYQNNMEKLISKFNSWKLEEEKEYSKVKLAIPNLLKDTVDYLNSLESE